jgi:hypothetical protein
MRAFLTVAGIVWFVGIVALFNVSWALRNRTSWARRVVDLLKQFTVQKNDDAILICALAGDLVFLMLFIGFVLGVRQ